MFRRDMNDAVVPYLWSAEEVLAYAADAYSMFFRLTGGISDSSNDDATLVSASAGEPFSDLHPSILTVRDPAYREADGVPVKIINYEDLPVLGDNDYGMAQPRLLTLVEGEIRYGVIGMEPDKIRWINVPSVAQDIRLSVYRLPLEEITKEDQELTDLASRHHFHLLKWMKALAYQKQDAETFDRSKSRECEADFRTYCAEVKAEWERKKHKPRTVAYGGI